MMISSGLDGMDVISSQCTKHGMDPLMKCNLFFPSLVEFGCIWYFVCVCWYTCPPIASLMFFVCFFCYDVSPPLFSCACRCAQNSFNLLELMAFCGKS